MKSLFNQDEKIVAALSYFLVFISGMIALVFEKDNKFVRFHGLQSTLWFLAIFVLRWAIGLVSSIPFVGWIIGLLLSPVSWALGIILVVSWLGLMFMAYQGREFKIPIIGDIAYNHVYK